MHPNVIIFQALQYELKKPTATYPEVRDLEKKKIFFRKYFLIFLRLRAREKKSENIF